jgi:RecB family endonuclease NucS
MTEHEREDLLWDLPERFLGEALRPFLRQDRTDVGRSDPIFEDRLDRLLIVEIKKDVERAAVGQISDYFAALKRRFPLRSVELMLVANQIREERRVALERLGIECWPISEARFRAVAREAG